MKKQVLFAFLLFISLAWLSLSCKSAPKPAETTPPAAQPATPPPAGGPSQASLDALNKAKANTDEARKRASDFEGPSYFPSDWESAEAQYTAAGNMPKTSDAEVDRAAAAYNSLTDAYDGIFNRTIPLYAQAREDEIIATRQVVINTGLTDSFPEYLPIADETALQALSQYEGKDYYSAKDSAAKALLMYQTLNIGADSWMVRQEITFLEFESYDPDNFNQAEETLLAAMDAYKAGNIASAHDSAEEALLRYNVVLSTGWASYAAQRAASAEAERQAALDIKANMAVRDIFKEADEMYNQAAGLLKAEKHEEAAVLYTQSEALFIVASLSAADKRQAAAQAIREAEEKIEESDETARQAEIVIEGGSK